MGKRLAEMALRRTPTGVLPAWVMLLFVALVAVLIAGITLVLGP